MHSIQRNISLHVPDTIGCSSTSLSFKHGTNSQSPHGYPTEIHTALRHCIHLCWLLRSWNSDMISKSRNHRIDRNYR